MSSEHLCVAMILPGTFPDWNKSTRACQFLQYSFSSLSPWQDRYSWLSFSAENG